MQNNKNLLKNQFIRRESNKAKKMQEKKVAFFSADN